jgi:diguanylate cyclase (GGDEF)-like protein
LDTQSAPPGEAEGRLLYLAEHLAELHASTDLRWLAGRFEFLGEKVLGASLTLLALPDERGAFRAVASASPRPASAHDARTALGIDALAGNATAARAFLAAEAAGRPVAVHLAELFPAAEGSAVVGQAIVAPLLCNREFLGAGLFVVDASPLGEQIAAVLAGNAAVAIAQIREREDARRLHSVDARLWVPDEHFLLDQFAREVNRSRRYGREVGLALLRLENEREVRARFGDFFTDHLLRRIGSQLLASVRDSDVLGALDGAYAVIHTETSQAGTQLSAERLRDAAVDMVRRRFPEVPEAEISVRTVAYPSTASTVEALVALLTGTAAEDVAA